MSREREIDAAIEAILDAEHPAGAGEAVPADPFVEFVRKARVEAATPIEPDVAQSHLSSMMAVANSIPQPTPASSGMGRAVKVWTAAFVVSVGLGSGALAGALPGPVQRAVSRAARVVGIALPAGTSEPLVVSRSVDSPTGGVDTPSSAADSGATVDADGADQDSSSERDTPVGSGDAQESGSDGGHVPVGVVGSGDASNPSEADTDEDGVEVNGVSPYADDADTDADSDSPVDTSGGVTAPTVDGDSSDSEASDTDSSPGDDLETSDADEVQSTTRPAAKVSATVPSDSDDDSDDADAAVTTTTTPAGEDLDSSADADGSDGDGSSGD